MRIFHFKTLVFVEEGCAESDDNIDEKEQVNASIDGWDGGASKLRVTFIGIKDLHWDEYRVIYGKHDDKVVPMLYKVAAARE